MARFESRGQDFSTKIFSGNFSRHNDVERQMVPRNSLAHRLLLDRRAQTMGVHLLCRACFVLIIVASTVANEAENEARKKGLFTVRAEPALMMGMHACMQPEAADLPDEPAPEKPPCPKTQHKQQ